MIKFNINDYICIQIKERGWSHLEKTFGKDYIKHCIKNREVIIDGEIWYRLQCHDVFTLLPTEFGKPILFNTNILIDNEA